MRVLLFCCLLICSVCFVWAQEEVSSEEFRTAIHESVEIDDTDVDLLLDALDEYEVENSRKSFEQLWRSEDVTLRFMSTALYLSILEEVELLVEADRLLAEFPDNELGVLSALVGFSPKGVDHVLEHYDSYDSEPLDLLLEALFEECAESKDGWLAIWEQHRDDYEELIVNVQQPIFKRNIALKAKLNALDDVVSAFPEDAPGMGVLSDIVTTLDDVRQAGATSERSEYVVQADRAFFFSRYQEAVDTYRLAVKEDPGDVYAFYLMGCALFELGHYSEAVQAFNQVVILDASVVSAEYLSKLAARRDEHRDEPLLTAAWLLAAENDISERIGIMGASDPIIQRLLGEQMLGESGIYQISDSELLEFAAAERDNPQLLAGLVLMTSREGKLKRVVEWSESYPDNALLQKAVFSFSQLEHRFDDSELVLHALKVCRKADPKNRYLLDVEVAWLGSRVQPLAVDQYPEGWSEFKMDVGPLSIEQLELIRKSSTLSECLSVSEELKQCAFVAMEHLSSAFRALDESRYKGSDFMKFRDLFNQLNLSIELALVAKDFEFADELLEYMDRMVVDMKGSASSLLEQMSAQALYGIAAESRAKSNRAQKILKQEDLNFEARLLDSPFRRAVGLYLEDAAFEMIPLPSLRNAFAELYLDPIKYMQTRADAIGDSHAE